MFKLSKVSIGVALAMGGMLTLPALAQESTQRIEITGSSIKRIDAETPLPVTVMTRDEISRTGVVNMEQLVATIATVSSAGNTTGSQTAGLATYGLSSISLRGLGEQRTLVLLNGRRLAVFAGGGTGGAVDINAIPVSAIDRIEVLRDGASAVYGSDAVAGVVNFILRKEYSGFELTANAGTPTTGGGGGKSYRANVLFGKGNLDSDKYNFMAGLDVEHSFTLYAKDRDFAKSGNVRPFFSNSATPSGRVEGIYDPTKSASANARKAATNPFGISGQGYGNPMAPDRCADINMFTAANGGVAGINPGNFPNCNFDSAPYVGLFPDIRRSTIFGSGKFALSPAATFYAEALYSKTKTTEAYQPSPVRNAFLATDTKFGDPTTVQPVPPVLLVYPTNPAYQNVFVPYAQTHNLQPMIDSGLPIAVSLRTFLTGPRTEEDTNEATRLIAGLQGTVGKWDYDVAASFNRAKTSGKVTNGYFSQYQLAQILDNPAVNWNPWAPGGAQDPSVDAALQTAKYIGPTVSGISKSTSLDATATTSLATLAGGPMQLALGAVVRRDTYKIDVPDALGTGDIAGLGGATLPVDTGRTAYAVYGELNAPITKTLELNGSVRFDHYNDVGSTTNGKVSARWRPNSQLLFRASAGSGFRAPTLYELHQPQILGTSEQFIDPLFPEAGEQQANAINSGNPNLKPEKSKQGALGIVFSPVRSLTMSADYFIVKIDNYIVKPAALGLINAVRAGSPLFGPNDATFDSDGFATQVDQTLRNAASLLTKGVDVSANWADRFPIGRLSVDLNGTYMQTYDLTTLSGVEHSVGTIIQPDGSPLTVAGLGVVARWKHVMTFGWSDGPWSATLAQNFLAGYQDANDLNGNPHYVPATTTYDAQVAFTGVKNLRVALGARNLFNKQPPLFIGNGSSFQYGYDPQNWDPRQRFVYLTATYKFW